MNAGPVSPIRHLGNQQCGADEEADSADEGAQVGHGHAEQLAGGWVRTHILRTTWHFVAAEDLRWVQRRTGPKIESSLAGRRRGRHLDNTTLGRALAASDASAGQAVHVGDGPVRDIAAAREVGMATVWVNRAGREWPPELAPPDLTVGDLYELRDWLARSPVPSGAHRRRSG